MVLYFYIIRINNHFHHFLFNLDTSLVLDLYKMARGHQMGWNSSGDGSLLILLYHYLALLGASNPVLMLWRQLDEIGTAESDDFTPPTLMRTDHQVEDPF